MKKILCKIPLIKTLLTKKAQVNILRLNGVLMSSSKGAKAGVLNLHDYKNIIDDAFSEPGINAVFLEINCPGGSPAQSELLATYLLQQSEKYNVPIFSFTEDVAASGGYWLACVGEKIYALKSSITGSIGVISASFGFHKLIETYGIERRLHTSGSQKSFLDPFSEEKKSDVTRLTNIQKDIHKHFIEWVKLRRGDALKGTDKTLFEGQFWLGEEAVDKGIIDHIGDSLSIAKELYGERVKIKYFQNEKGFFSSIFSLKVAPDLNALNQETLWQKFNS